MVSPPGGKGPKETRNKEDNTIISNSTLRKILPPQLKNMTAWYKLMRSCECCISAKSMHFSLWTWSYRHLKNLKDSSHNSINRRSGKLLICIFETYKNAVRLHGFHIYNSAAYMAMAKVCPCTSQHYKLPHCECVLRCC